MMWFTCTKHAHQFRATTKITNISQCQHGRGGRVQFNPSLFGYIVPIILSSASESFDGLCVYRIRIFFALSSVCSKLFFRNISFAASQASFARSSPSPVFLFVVHIRTPQHLFCALSFSRRVDYNLSFR